MNGAVNLTLRAMTLADLDDVLALEARTFSDPWTRANFDGELSNTCSTVQLAHDESGQLLGYVVFWTVADEIQVLHVAVDPNLRRQGLATQLMDHVFHCANEAESRLITLECRQSNGAAIGLYSAAGFERVAVRSSYYAHGKEDAIIMQLNLNREPHAL